MPSLDEVLRELDKLGVPTKETVPRLEDGSIDPEKAFGLTAEVQEYIDEYTRMFGHRPDSFSFSDTDEMNELDKEIAITEQIGRPEKVAILKERKSEIERQRQEWLNEQLRNGRHKQYDSYFRRASAFKHRRDMDERRDDASKVDSGLRAVGQMNASLGQPTPSRWNYIQYL
jgi:hypothetical protein